MELNEQIRQLAFELYEKNGCVEGRDLDNWLEAEKTISSQNQEGHAEEQLETKAETEVELESVV